MPYNTLTGQWELDLPNIKGATNYFGTTFGTNSTSSQLVAKNNPIFKNGVFDKSALDQTLNYKFQIPTLGETISSISSNPTADPVADAAKKSGKGLLGGKGMQSFAKFGKANADLVGAAPDLIESGLKLGGVKEADTASGGEKVFQQATTAAFKGALKTGNPIAIGVTGALKGLDMLNRYAGSTAQKQGTVGIDTGGYTTQISQNAGAKQTVLGSIGWGGKKSSKTAAFNKQTQTADRSNLLASRAAYGNQQNQIAAQNTYGDIATGNQRKLFGGINTNVVSSKKGGTINPKKLSNIKKRAQANVKAKITKAQEGSDIDDGQKFSVGGKINVIPEGALHARKNNYEGELAEQVTNKGIPVITYDEGNKITQHAEIEHSEIIFNKDVTTELEAWFKEYNDADSSKKKELEIKCGKLLTEEILENTIDNVGLLDNIE